MKFDEYYIEKIDDLGYSEGYAAFIWRDKTISNEDKLDLCIQLFEQKQFELESEKSPIDVWTELYPQFSYFEKKRIWTLYRKYLTSRKALPNLLVLESILIDFVNEDEFIVETLVAEFGKGADEQKINAFIKSLKALPQELLNSFKAKMLNFNLAQSLIEKLMD